MSQEEVELTETPLYKLKWSEVEWSLSVVSDSLWSHRLYIAWNSPGQNTGKGGLSLFQGIFPTRASNPGLQHCRQILYHLSHQGSPRPCSLPVLRIGVCICYYQTPNLSPFPSLPSLRVGHGWATSLFFLSFPSPLVTINLFPMSVLSHPWWYLLKRRIFYFLWSSIYFSLVAWAISKKSVPNQRSVCRVLCVCVKSLSCVQLFVILRTVARPGYSVYGILQAGILEWVAMSSSRGSSWPRDRTHVSYISYTGKRVL